MIDTERLGWQRATSETETDGTGAAARCANASPSAWCPRKSMVETIAGSQPWPRHPQQPCKTGRLGSIPFLSPEREASEH